MTTSQPLKTILFDLDGTLIDSAPSILACFEDVLRQAGVPPCVPVTSSLIGPPLKQTLAILTGIANEDVLENLAARFRESYDSDGYKKSLIYPGIEDQLELLYTKKVPLAIATNKRRVPTLKILDHFGWNRHFQVVGTLDKPGTQFKCKAEVISALLYELDVDASAAAYVGDTTADREAATAVGMKFFAAGWGYGNWASETIMGNISLLEHPSCLAKEVCGG